MNFANMKVAARLTDIMDEISAASTDQIAGVAQVDEAVSNMDWAN